MLEESSVKFTDSGSPITTAGGGGGGGTTVQPTASTVSPAGVAGHWSTPSPTPSWSESAEQSRRPVAGSTTASSQASTGFAASGSAVAAAMNSGTCRPSSRR